MPLDVMLKYRHHSEQNLCELGPALECNSQPSFNLPGHSVLLESTDAGGCMSELSAPPPAGSAALGTLLNFSGPLSVHF